MAAAAELFRQAASSLSLLERALANLERMVSAVLPNPADGLDVAKREEFAERVQKHVEGSFQQMNDQVRASALTLRHIVADPAQGLGPARNPGLGLEVRQRLAAAAGLSRRALKLL